jgi:hypothetical protein
VSRVAAVMALRFRLLARRLRGPGGIANLIGAILTTLFAIAFALGMAVGFGLMIHLFAADGDPGPLRTGFLIVFYVAGVLGILIPLLRGTMSQGFDAAPLLVYPISRPRLYAITVGASFGASDHLIYYPALAAVALTGVVLPGIDAWAGLALIGLSLVCFVAWGNTLALFLVSVMRARRVREIVGSLAFLLLVGASFAPALVDGSETGREGLAPRLRSAMHVAAWAGQVLPPTLAADGLGALHAEEEEGAAATSLFWLLVWNAAGVALGYFVFARYHLGERGAGVDTRRRERRVATSVSPGRFSFDRPPWTALPSPVRAVAGKDLHYLFRSVLGKFNLFMMPAFVLIVVFLVGRTLEEPILGLEPRQFLLFGLLIYAVLFSNNFVNNALAWEGDGVQSYYLCPASPRHVLLGKNLAVWLFNAILFAIVIVVFSAFTGLPGFGTLVSATLMYAAVLLLFTCCGNLISVMLPVPRDMSAINNQPSQMAILLSLLILAVLALLVGPLLTLPVLLGWPAAVRPILLTALLGGAVVVYGWVLGQAARLLEERREQIVETLRSVR